MDTPTFDSIEAEIRESCERYIPNLKITKVGITAASSEEETFVVTNEGNSYNRNYSMPNLNSSEYTAKVRIDYVITDNVFNSKDFVIINI
jgi:hypothetical protein